MRDVGQQQGACVSGDLPHPRKIDDSRISAGADSDHLWAVFPSHLGQLIVIDALVLFAHAIMDDLKKSAGEICLVAVSQMPAMAQIHGQHLVAGFQEGEIDSHVGLAAGMGLHIGVLGAKEFFGAVDGQLLDDIDVFTAAIPALFRITFGVFVGQHRALSFHHGRAGEVLAGNQLDILLLALAFVVDRFRHLRVHGL